jgi:hypothetical protein
MPKAQWPTKDQDPRPKVALRLGFAIWDFVGSTLLTAGCHSALDIGRAPPDNLSKDINSQLNPSG